MPIDLEKRPSTDGLGVKRWTWPINDMITLYIFERPPPYRLPYLLRLDHKDGRTLDTRFARFKSQALDKAQWLAMRVERRELA